jgi:hypothetical protein
MEENNKHTQRMVIVGVIGFVVGFGVAWAVLQEKPPRSATEGEDGLIVDENGLTTLPPAGLDGTSGDGATTGGDETVATPPPPSASAIVAVDQASGSSVVVNRLVLAERSWVVIYEDERGRPARILGAGRFPVGVHSDVVIDLQRPTEDAGVYYAMLHHTDENDEFDPQSDLPLTDSSGTPIMIRFETVGDVNI